MTATTLTTTRPFRPSSFDPEVHVLWRPGVVRMLMVVDSQSCFDDSMGPEEARAYADLLDEEFGDGKHAWLPEWLRLAADAAEALERGERLEVPGAQAVLVDDDEFTGRATSIRAAGGDRRE